MNEYWMRLLNKPSIGIEVMLSTIFIAVLGFAYPLASINIFNNYLLFGLSGTLLAIFSGAFIAVILENILRQARMRSLRFLCDNRDKTLFLKAKNPMLVDKLTMVRKIFGPRAMSDWTDLPIALIFTVALFMIHWSLAVVALTFLTLVYGIGFLSKINTGEILADRQKATNELSQASNDNIEKSLESLIKYDNKIEGKNAFLEGFQRMLASMISISVLSFGALLTFKGAITPGELIAANILASRTYMILSKWNSGAENRLLGSVALAQLQRASIQQMKPSLTIMDMKEKINVA